MLSIEKCAELLTVNSGLRQRDGGEGEEQLRQKVSVWTATFIDPAFEVLYTMASHDITLVEFKFAVSVCASR